MGDPAGKAAIWLGEGELELDAGGGVVLGLAKHEGDGVDDGEGVHRGKGEGDGLEEAGLQGAGEG